MRISFSLSVESTVDFNITSFLPRISQRFGLMSNKERASFHYSRLSMAFWAVICHRGGNGHADVELSPRRKLWSELHLVILNTRLAWLFLKYCITLCTTNEISPDELLMRGSLTRTYFTPECNPTTLLFKILMVNQERQKRNHDQNKWCRAFDPNNAAYGHNFAQYSAMVTWNQCQLRGCSYVVRGRCWVQVKNEVSLLSDMAASIKKLNFNLYICISFIF